MEEKNNFVHGVAYGKLYLAGEYAILEDYASALITSVPKKITVFVEESDKTTIFDTINKTSVGLFEENNNFTLVQQFIQFLTEYTNSDKTFALTIFNELHNDDKKYGLGSSGAVLVAIARAILSFENITYNDLTIFKLVALFNIKHNLSGSMGDVAASINDGITFYQKFNAEFVNNMIRQNKSVKEIINTNWDGLLIEKIGEITESNALAMHGTTSTSTPSFSFLTEESHLAMNIVKELRSKGYRCYFTMDAGPNVKVLYLREDQDKLYEEISKLWKKKIILCME